MRLFPLPSYAVPLGLWGTSPRAVWLDSRSWSVHLEEQVVFSANSPVSVAITPVSLTIYCPACSELKIFVPPLSVAEEARVELPSGRLLGAFSADDPRSFDRMDIPGLQRIRVGDWVVLVDFSDSDNKKSLVSSVLKKAALVYDCCDVWCLGEEIPGADNIDWIDGIQLVYDAVSGKEFLVYDKIAAYYYYVHSVRIAYQICEKELFFPVFHIAKHGDFWFFSHGSFIRVVSPYGQIRWAIPSVEVAFRDEMHILGAMGHIVFDTNEILEWARFRSSPAVP